MKIRIKQIIQRIAERNGVPASHVGAIFESLVVHAALADELDGRAGEMLASVIATFITCLVEDNLTDTTRYDQVIDDCKSEIVAVTEFMCIVGKLTKRKPNEH